MKIVLIVPPWTYKDIRAEDTQGIAGAWPPVGTLYIASVLKQSGHEVVFFEGAFYDRQEMVKKIIEEEPDVLGAFVIAMFWDRTKKLFRELKEQYPDVFIVAGGHGPTALKERCLEECDELDAVVLEEGEYTMRELTENLSRGRSLRGVKGAIVREGGEIISNPKRPFIKNLDELPFPDMDLAELKRYRPSYGQVMNEPALQVISSRGCINACLYCFRMMGKKLIRFRSPENVADEIEYYVEKYGAKDIKFWDECFTLDKERVLGICDEILTRGLRVNWWISARADYVDKEMLRMMKRAGCWCINFGVESGVQKNLDVLRKNLTVEQIRTAVKSAHAAGIKTFTTYILGIPGETFDEGLKTIDLAIELNSFITEFFPLSPFPGTDLWNDADKYGEILRDMTDIGLLKQEIPFRPFTMTKEDVAELRRLAYRKFYIRPRYFLTYLKGIRTWFDVKAMFHGALALLKISRNKEC